MRYADSAYRLLIVGKPHRIVENPHCPFPKALGCLDLDGYSADWFFNHPGGFWRYTRAIVSRVYGNNVDGWQQIAVTTLVKCANAAQGFQDRTTRAMAESCISRLGVIASEIRYLEPRTMVFYTVKLHPDLLRELPIGEWRDITPQDHKVPCGRRTLGWWERRCRTAWDQNVRVLITEHPLFKPKEYRDEVARWIVNSE